MTRRAPDPGNREFLGSGGMREWGIVRRAVARTDFHRDLQVINEDPRRGKRTAAANLASQIRCHMFLMHLEVYSRTRPDFNQ
jgi:hypothetical protein